MLETPTYIKALLMPNGKKPAGRRVWSIDLETVWIPFFTATNTMGETAISHESLGAPLRLGYNGDGTVKFSRTGRPVVKVVKELQDTVRMMRENFIAQLVSHANAVATENPDGYKAQVEASIEAGKPIVDQDNTALTNALIAMAQAEAKAKGKRNPEPELVAVP